MNGNAANYLFSTLDKCCTVVSCVSATMLYFYMFCFASQYNPCTVPCRQFILSTSLGIIRVAWVFSIKLVPEHFGTRTGQVPILDAFEMETNLSI